jgi:hypothetical protein
LEAPLTTEPVDAQFINLVRGLPADQRTAFKEFTLAVAFGGRVEAHSAFFKLALVSGHTPASAEAMLAEWADSCPLPDDPVSRPAGEGSTFDPS